MTKFDAPSIYDKSLSKLQQNPDWKPVASNGVITAILKSNAEVLAEVARYAEYLFKESKGDTAQNRSSILSMANTLGYQAKRRISARGSILVSTDPRTHLVGKTISSETFKAMSSGENTLGWSKPAYDLSILSTCEIVDSKGVSYIASPTVFDSDNLYCEVNIMQGKRKSTFIDIGTIRRTASLSKLDPYVYIPVVIQNCEDASNTFSKSFFRVYVMYSSIGTNETVTTSKEYRVIDSLLFSNNSDYDVEVYNDFYNQELFYLKFNNDPSRGKTLDLTQNTNIIGIRVDYVESLGASGNLMDIFENFTITGVTTSSGTSTGSKLYGINYNAIVGGADEEEINEVKKNATKFYINNYTAGTKEAYEKTIANMEFAIENVDVRPKKVQVYGGEILTDNGMTRPVTYISFIADGLEDIATSSSSAEDAYEQITKALNYYLTKLKSPQDVLRFIAPEYIPFALGLECIVNRGESDLISLAANVQNYIEDQWGPNSDLLDFGRDFYPSSIINGVMNKFSSILAIKTEVEAIKKLKWSEATRKAPYSEIEQPTAIHTFRIPFDFNRVFLGNESLKGFKDCRVGADYVIRFDFMYKKPSSMLTSINYHTSLFVEESDAKRSTDAFYIKKDTSQNATTWPSDVATNNNNYVELADISILEKAWQFRYRDKVYDDDAFRELIDKAMASEIPTLTSYLTDPGAIDSYIIYFSSNYNEESTTIGEGWIEMTFDPFYRMLSTFALFDTTLATKLKNCSLSLLKCGTSEQGAADVFDTFVNIIKDYVDIYVSLRPIDEDLYIKDSEVNSEDGTITESSSVLYIDSYDNTSASSTAMNLTNDKKPRMISVSCKYGEY